MNLIELQRALRQLRLGGTAAVLEARLHQAQAEAMAPIDLISCLTSLTQNQIGRRLSLVGDSVPKPLRFTAFSTRMDALFGATGTAPPFRPLGRRSGRISGFEVSPEVVAGPSVFSFFLRTGLPEGSLT
jgi:hypothetical protein